MMSLLSSELFGLCMQGLVLCVWLPSWKGLEDLASHQLQKVTEGRLLPSTFQLHFTDEEAAARLIYEDDEDDSEDEGEQGI